MVSARYPALREHLLAEIGKTRWVPPEGRARIAAMVTNRPDWCLSRQRDLGHADHHPLLREDRRSGDRRRGGEAIERQAAAHGTDFWFEKWGETLMPEDWPFLPKHPALADGFRRESDILDVWLDSGVSWLSVLGEDHIADLYLEGSDQHRGAWFQSSLVMSTALRGHAPYRAVLSRMALSWTKGPGDA